MLGNCATHRTRPCTDGWWRIPRFLLHFTPASASWLNLVERWFAEPTKRRLRRSSHRSRADLAFDARTWIEAWNTHPRPFVWTRTADEVLNSLAGVSRARMCRECDW
ncbi:hypothetical protein Van01_51600 [Micromonospora andamanensis]|uniref:DDE superfamily endonuclease n=1 Tax=Micromonospora andamanensis TaxID=1287068 RepID=A0ABQ4I2B4_9ACTN|nr:hypothetical protein Van01_51600 [Micromonospora andamanensis]